MLRATAALGYGQYHLAVAGGYAVGSSPNRLRMHPTSYRKVVLTVSKCGFGLSEARPPAQLLLPHRGSHGGDDGIGDSLLE